MFVNYKFQSEKNKKEVDVNGASITTIIINMNVHIIMYGENYP